MNDGSKPNLVFIAGPNGAGKTTVAEFLISNRSIRVFVNADTIAQGIGRGQEQQTSEISAGKIMLASVHEKLALKQDITLESTMSGRNWKTLIERAKKNGYECSVCYIAVISADIAVERVQKRVKEGGHHIPTITVRRRYERSLANFFSIYSKLADNWYFFDNSESRAVLLAYKEYGSKEKLVQPDQYGLYSTRAATKKSGD